MSRSASPGRTLGRRVGRRLTDWLPRRSCSSVGSCSAGARVALFDVQRFLLPEAVRDPGHPLGAARRRSSPPAGTPSRRRSAASSWAARPAVARRDRTGPLPPPRPRAAAVRIAANAVPIIAFAPIANQWFGPLEKTSKMAIAAILVLLPGAGEHAARPHLGAPLVDRAHALVRGRRGADLPPGTDAERASVHLFLAEGGDRARDDRRDRGRVLPQLARARSASRSGTRRRSSSSRSPGRRSSSRACSGSSSTHRSRSSSGLTMSWHPSTRRE